jgi:hypothetical protein
MARLTYSERKGMKSSEFAAPQLRKGGKGGYPDEDRGHARAALQRASEFASPKVEAQVERNVHKKFPDMEIKGMKHEKHESRSHHGMGESLHKRGHHENHGKGEISHETFHALDHGSKHDHMEDRDGKADGILD